MGEAFPTPLGNDCAVFRAMTMDVAGTQRHAYFVLSQLVILRWRLISPRKEHHLADKSLRHYLSSPRKFGNVLLVTQQIWCVFAQI